MQITDYSLWIDCQVSNHDDFIKEFQVQNDNVGLR
jgi:hypothetical protein